jgi:hypothetical protein
VPGEGRDLRHGRLSERQTDDCRPPKIMKRQAADTGACASLGPRGAKAVRGPGAAVGVGQDQRAAASPFQGILIVSALAGLKIRPNSTISKGRIPDPPWRLLLTGISLAPHASLLNLALAGLDQSIYRQSFR